MYLKEIGQVHLLETQQEVWLAIQMSASRYLEQLRDRLQEAHEHQRAPHADELMLDVYDDFVLQWQQFEKIGYKAHMKKVDLHALLTEVPGAARGARCWNSLCCIPRPPRNAVPPRADRRWHEAISICTAPISGLYCLPLESIDWLVAHLHKKDAHLPQDRAVAKVACRTPPIHISLHEIETQATRAKQACARQPAPGGQRGQALHRPRDPRSSI